MAITIGGVSTALVGFQSEDGGGALPHSLLASAWQSVMHRMIQLSRTRPTCPGRGLLVTSWCVGAGHESGPITPGTTDLITILLTPVAVAMVIYALFCFYWRSIFLSKKQVRHFFGVGRLLALLRVAFTLGISLFLGTPCVTASHCADGFLQ